jgi:hypothetical protein
VDDVLTVQLIQVALQAAPLVAVQIEKSDDFAESERPCRMPADKLEHFLFLR